MSSRHLVFDLNGHMLAELNVGSRRSWLMNQVGRCDLIMSMRDPKAVPAIIKPGNMLLIQHEALPDWVGVFDTPVGFGYGMLNLVAYSAEVVFGWRRTPLNKKISGTAGGLFAHILDFINAEDYNEKPIYAGEIYEGGPDREETLGDLASVHLQRIATRADQYFDVTPNFTEAQTLQLLGNWYARRGQDLNLDLIEGKHIELKQGQLLVYDGNVVNDLMAYGDATTKSKRLTYQAVDEDSISLYGLRQFPQVFAGNKEMETLKDNALKYIKGSKQPSATLDLLVADVNDVLKHMVVGNTLRLLLNNAGFMEDRLGFDGRVSLTAVEYDDFSNTVQLNVEEVHE